LAKKKRKPSAAATAARSRTPATPAVTTPAATPGGPNRPARKEEARRQREALRRRMARRRYYRVGGAVLAVVLVASTFGILAGFQIGPFESASKAAGCGPVVTVRPYPGKVDRAHISAQGAVKTPPPLSTYPGAGTHPPVSGPHNPVPLPAGVYSNPPAVDRVIHSLEHGSVAIWYSPRAAGTSAVTDIRTFFRDPVNNDHVIVAPFDYPDQGRAGHLPAGKQMVLVFWHHSQSCDTASLAAVRSFVDHYRIPSTRIPPLGYPQDGAPEPGSPIG